MRIAMFEDTYWPKIDGINTSVELFTRELRKRGHEVLVIAPKHPSADYTTQPVDDDTILLQSVQTEWLYPGTALGKFWKGMGKGVVAERFARWRPDILHSHTEFTIGLWMGSYWRTKLAPLGTRRVHTYHTLWTEYLFYLPLPEAATQPLVRWIAPRTAKKRYDGVIAPTEKMRLRRGEQKVRFVVAGNGPERYVEKLKKQAVDMGLRNIAWTGFVRGQEWLDAYAAADVLLFPSVTETQGLVVTEALAAGVPLVSVEVMGPASTMKGERGCLFADNDAGAFATATQRLLHDQVLYERKKREAQVIARASSIEKRTDELLAVYERVLGA